jgi:predicted DCC family thiol-disulfide oxidoreductase YuxK
VDVSILFVVALVALIFIVDGVMRWWRQNRWRYRRRDDDEDHYGHG